jgi:hypothetical protein
MPIGPINASTTPGMPDTAPMLHEHYMGSRAATRLRRAIKAKRPKPKKDKP